jgi:hypothetical protein
LVILCDQIKRQLEDIRDFFQSCGCSLSPDCTQAARRAFLVPLSQPHTEATAVLVDAFA